MDESKEQLLGLLSKALKTKGVDTPAYKERLKAEWWEINAQGEFDYYLDLHRRSVHYAENEYNQLVPWLLDLCPKANIEQEFVTVTGEFPDVDVDYLPDVKDHLKQWAKDTFGLEMVCPIGTLGTFGIKGAVKDMGRVFGLDHGEINAITTEMEDKDDDGKPITWDKAVEIFPEFKSWCERNSDCAEAAKMLLNRNKSLGKHAGGLIISSKRIDNIVPLIKNKEESELVSAFTEGLHGTDLGPLGLIKFDLLSILDLLRIVICVNLIKKRHGVKSVCALKDGPSWSDTAYLNDPDALAMADKGDLKCVFQFGSPGIRKMVRDGGVNSFDDLATYSALYRPGPIRMKMHEAFIRRKKDEEEYEVHPLMQPALGYTHGVMAFQEQVMQILNIVGGIPHSMTEKVRKAISKKKVKEFAPYKEVFLANGTKRLGWSVEQVEELWKQIEAFAEYGFNRSHSVAYTVISSRLLWLKTHFPLEFYCATLQIEDDTDTIKEYKRDAEAHGVTIEKLDLNKSQWTYSIVDEKIYMGFVNVKGIGEAVAKRIVDCRPEGGYNNLEHFLECFGSEASVLKPFIGLGLFGSDDRCSLYEYAMHFKDVLVKRRNRDKTNENARSKIAGELAFLMGHPLPSGCDEHEPELLKELRSHLDLSMTCENEESLGDWIAEQPKLSTLDLKSALKLVKKYRKKIEDLQKKQALDSQTSFKDFVKPEKWKWVDEKLEAIYTDISTAAEAAYYGFGWKHPLEFSPDYSGNRTLDQFKDANIAACLCEVMVVKAAEKKLAKNGKTVYYTMRVEDANFHQAGVTIWEEDYNRFSEEFSFFDDKRKIGNMIKIKLEPPNGFASYTFNSPPKQRRHIDIPKEKEKDHRVILMESPYNSIPVRQPEPQEDELVALTDDELAQAIIDSE